MNQLISVITPVYNHTAELKPSLLSLKNQTYNNLEIIIVDDGNEKPLVSNKYKIIRQKNAGASAARNRGFAEAHGDYVIFWDADTVANPDMLEKLKKQLEAHPEASYAYCKFKFGWKTMRGQPFNANDLKKNNYIDTTSLIRRQVLVPLLKKEGAGEVRFAGPFDPALKRFQDWDLWLSLLAKNKTGIFVPEVLFKKLVNGRKGMSKWLPGFVFKWFKNNPAAREYEEAKRIVLRKYGL